MPPAPFVMCGCMSLRNPISGASDSEASVSAVSFVGSSLRWSFCLMTLVLASVFCASAPSQAADYRSTEQLFFAGKYSECEAVCQSEVDRGVWNANWPTLLIRCQLTTGQYEAAERTYVAAMSRFKTKIGLRLIGHEVYNFVDKPEIARQQYATLYNLVRNNAWQYSSAADRLVIGRFLLRQGEDAREVLELAYDRARKSKPKLPDVFIATAELALEKHDYQEAAKSLEQAVQLQPSNPYVHLLMAKAWGSSDPKKAAAAIQTALKLNPRHVPSLLFQADNFIDGEKYHEASELLTKVFEVNHRHPEAWAYHAVIAHLQGHDAGEVALRNAALESWSTNPNVDHLIGSKLSRKYRFAEGAEYQRSALQFDPNLLPAKLQLSQDLLRLGDEEGWKLVSEVNASDGYNVVAFNAVTLRDEMAKFATLETDRFIVRMDARESRIYGQQVLDLLNEAHDFMCTKYDVTLDGPVTVEIFPRQKDFAIRTFGLPGGAGFLGVCFGRVITANSPSSQGERPANWRSVLWHEFCHVVTLEKTRNKMPRWISEGISTYEEQEKNDSWGERLTPSYRGMIHGADLTPVSQLSAAFLSPKSPNHLQFAYYESALVVRYLVDKYGIEMLKRVLTDLGVGMPINESLTRYVGSLSKLDADFAAYAREYTDSIAPGVEWSMDEELAKAPIDAAKVYLNKNPNNYQAVTHYAKLAIDEARYEEAEKLLLSLRKLHPEDRMLSGTLGLLGLLYRKTEDPAKEAEVMAELARLNDRGLEVYARLAELRKAEGDWESIRENAHRYLSVQPMLPTGHEMLAEAAEQLNRPDELAQSLTALLEMNPIDPAGIHFRIAKAHQLAGDREMAKRHVLMALEHAPRYRDAQKMLLQLIADEPDKDEGALSRTSQAAVSVAGAKP